MEKQPDWRMGISVFVRPVWYCMLFLCLCWMRHKATQPVCVEADKWSICYVLCLQLEYHRARWRYTKQRRHILRFTFKHYWVICLQLCLHGDELQKCLFPEAVVHNIVVLLSEGVQPKRKPRCGVVRSAFLGLDFNNRRSCFLSGVLRQQSRPDYDLS